MCAILTACASTAAAASADYAADIAKAANVGQDGLVMYASSAFATANGGRKNVDFVAGVYAQSAGRIHFLSYDRITKSFRQDMSFETASIPGVALLSGPMGRKQLQIKTETGVVACEFSGFMSSGKVASQAYDHLIAAGVHPFDSPGWVASVLVPQPTVITVYIPAHR